MEASSSQTYRGPGPWQGLLLAVSLSTFWIPPVTAKPTVESAPLHAAEGQNVLLLMRSVKGDPLLYEWYKGATTDSNQHIVSHVVSSHVNIPGLAHSGRETIYTNGSLLIQKVTQNDAGSYTFAVSYTDGNKDIATGQLRVHPELLKLKPHITSNNPNPVEDKDPVQLTCEPETPNTTYLWSINSQSLPDSPSLWLSKDKRTLTLLRVTRNDTGPYMCDNQNPVSARRSDPFILNVLYGPDTLTISPSHTYYHPGANLILSCHAASNPPARYSWLINGISQHYTQELVIPNVTESNSGSYTCLAHNSATGLYRILIRMIKVYKSVAPPSIQASNTTVTEHKDQVVLTCLTRDTGISILWLLNNQHLQLTDRRKLSWDNRTLTINPVRREDAGAYQCEVSNPVSSSKSDPITLTVTAAEDTTNLSISISSEVITAIMIGTPVGVALAVTLGCVLMCRRSGRNTDKCGLPKHQPPASSPGWAPSGCSTPSASKSDAKPTDAIYQELQHPNTDTYHQINPKASGVFVPYENRCFRSC